LVGVVVFLVIHTAHTCVCNLLSDSLVAVYRDGFVLFDVGSTIPRQIQKFR
jgi:hypothetical protein